MFFFGIGYFHLCRRLVLLLSLSIYAGNVVKDYLCLPRPREPVLLLSGAGLGEDEFGFPSTHTVLAVNLPLFLLMECIGTEHAHYWPIILCVGVAWMVLVSYSRMYLGMHGLVDIVGGAILSIIVLVAFSFLGIANSLDTWAMTGVSVPLIAICGGVLLLWLSPTPCRYCPCFEDSTCFVSSAVGLLCAASRFPGIPVMRADVHLVILRYTLGMCILYLFRMAMKKLLHEIFPPLFSSLGIPPRAHKKPSLNKDGQNKEGKVNDSFTVDPFSPTFIEDGKMCEHRLTTWDVDIAVKYVVYLGMGWLTAEGVPRLLIRLNLI